MKSNRPIGVAVGLGCVAVVAYVVAQTTPKANDNALKFWQENVVRIKGVETEIESGLGLVRLLRRKNMAYWGEVATSRVIELEGKWSYVVRGTNSHGDDYEHHGLCDFKLEGKSLVIVGQRVQTTVHPKDSTNKPVVNSYHSPWKSSPLEFSKSSQGEQFEFKYVINVEGKDERGICVCRLDPRQCTPIEGKLWLNSEKGTVEGKIQFDKS